MPAIAAADLLQHAHTYLREAIAPRAEHLDRDPEALRQALQGLGDRHLLGLKVPAALGGTDVGEDYPRYAELVPRYSGALSFLQNQHQSAVAMLAASSNRELKQTHFPQAARGTTLIGVGFSHLRRPTGSPLNARPVPDGYLLTGTVPWITGAGHFQHVILGAELPDGEGVYGLAPLHSHQQARGGTFTLSDPMDLAAMSATQTVSATLNNWHLPAASVVKLAEPGAIHHSDRRTILNHGFYAIGCARAGLDILQRASQRLPSATVRATWDRLDRALETLRDRVYAALPPDPEDFARNLTLRSRAIHLAGTCARAAVIASSGAANTLQHPAQRVYREALVFSVSGQTPAVRDASLEWLAREVLS